MSGNYSLPEPDPLGRAALIKYHWGQAEFEIVCTACSVRTVAWHETGEPVTWLYCTAMRTAEINPEGVTHMMRVLIPAHYVTSIEPGPPFQITRSRKVKEIGLFPPNQPTPVNHLSLQEIERVLASLLAPERN